MNHADADLQPLFDSAIAATQHAYIPYSHYPVGAALRAADGRVFTGCNVENASFGVTICAERTALVKAVSEGYREFNTIVVATPNGGSPCGICRQALFEFAPQLRVIMIDLSGKVAADYPLSDMLLGGFGPSSLPR